MLQELTAARSLIFRCGQSEMQATTFLSGLVNLPTSFDWRLHNRIQAFIQLVRSSERREHLKGKAHLNIDSLVELVDKFRAHSATDPRDKIYALWGLSSDATLMKTLQPDYRKTTKNLMEELAHVVFGEEAIVLASDTKQMVYIRCPCYSVGKIYEAPKTNMWDTEQHLQIVSLRANMHLQHEFTWHQDIRVRTSAEETRSGDIFLYIPTCKKLAVVRQDEYYFRVISVIDSEKVISHGSELCWGSWASRLNEKADFKNDFPLLWNWEYDQPDENSAALRLVQTYHLITIDQADMEHAQAYSRVQALSEMASLCSEWDDHESACSRLSAVVNIYSSTYCPEAEVVTAENDRLASITKRRDLYVKAKELLIDQSSENDPQLPPYDCIHIIAHANMGLTFNAITDQDFLSYLNLLQSRWDNPSHVLRDLASKTMSRGVSKTMILDAIELCTLDWEHIRFTATNYRLEKEYLPVFTHERIRLLPLDNTLHSEYLRLLLQLCGDDILLSKEEVLKASHAFIGPWELNQLIKRCETRVDNFSDVLKALESRRVGGGSNSGPAYRALGGDHVKGVLEGNADRVLITSETVLVAVKWHVDAVSAVLEAASDSSVITSTVLDTALSDWQTVGPRTIELLMRKMEIKWIVSEDAFIKFLEAKNPIEVQVDSILLTLLRENKVTINITERIILKVLSHQEKILQFLHFGVDMMLIKDLESMVQRLQIQHQNLLHGHAGTEQTISILRALQQSLGPIDNGIVNFLSPEDVLGHAHLLNLVRSRRSEIAITEEMILKAANHNNYYLRSNHWDDRRTWRSGCDVEDFTSCLIKHADQATIDALAQSHALKDAVAYRAYPRVIESLKSRLKNPQPDIEMLCEFAILCRSIEESRFLNKPLVCLDLVKSLEKMSLSSNLQQSLLIRVLNLQYEDERAEFLKELIKHRVVGPGIPDELQEAILRGVIKRVEIAWKDFGILLRHGIIGVEVVYADNRTPLHVLLDYHNPEEDRAVDMLMQYGAIANVDVQDTKGRIPRQIIHQRIQKYDDPYRYSILARLDGAIGTERNSGQTDEPTQ